MSFDFDVFLESVPKLYSVLGITLCLLVFSAIAGFFLASVSAVLSLSKNRLVSLVMRGYLFFFRGTPLLVQLYLVYYGSGQFKELFETLGLWPLFSSAFFCAWFTFTLNTGAYLGEVIKGGILNIPRGEIEAAVSFGMSRYQLYRGVILPRVYREMIPAWGNEMILLLKASSLASTVTIIDLMGMARKVASDTFAPIEAFIAAAIFYLILTSLITLIFNFCEFRYLPYRRS